MIYAHQRILSLQFFNHFTCTHTQYADEQQLALCLPKMKTLETIEILEKSKRCEKSARVKGLARNKFSIAFTFFRRHHFLDAPCHLFLKELRLKTSESKKSCLLFLNLQAKQRVIHIQLEKQRQRKKTANVIKSYAFYSLLCYKKQDRKPSLAS